MSTSESLEALRRANPRATNGFPHLVDQAAAIAHGRLAEVDVPAQPRRTSQRRRLVPVSAVGAAVVAAAVATFLTIGSPGAPGIEDAAAAMRHAASVTATSAEQSGTAVVRITNGGDVWAESTIRWNGDDLAVAQDYPVRAGETKRELRVVDGTMYGPDPGTGGWLELGPPESVDPDSGTTPNEVLAAVHEDIGGVTLRRITGGMTGLTSTRRDDGSTVYRGAVPAGLIAREAGFKEGEALRVLPFGYVAHGEAADPHAPLDAAVTVAADGTVREIVVSWGDASSSWTYTVAYSGLGATPAPVAPENPVPLRRSKDRIG